MIVLNSNTDTKRRIFRIKVLFVIMLSGLCGILYKAFELQIVRAKELRLLSEKQSHRMITLAPRRGRIFDATGNELARSVEVGSVYARPQQVADPEYTAKLLSSRLHMSEGSIKKQLRSDKQFVWIKRQVSPDVAQGIDALNLPGIQTVREFKRFYPNKNMASAVLGFTGLDSQGLEGIEFYFDNYLNGETQYLFAEKDAYGRSIVTNPPELSLSGDDIVLTINRGIQFVLEEELKRTVENNKAKKGIAIMMDIRTGALLAMAQYPDFNPNIFERYPRETWRNSAVADIYEPGSTFKVFLFSAALEAGIISPKSVMYCENGEYQVTESIVIHDVKKFTTLTVPEILAYSSNICAAKIAKQLGKEKFMQYINKFGFGQKSGIELPGDAKGIVRPVNKLNDIEAMILGFGQGISVTPIQLITAFNSIINDGELVKPTIVKSILSEDGKVIYKALPQPPKRVISVRTARLLRGMLLKAVMDGTGRGAFIDGYGSGGKTGTAQKIDPLTGSYSSDRFTGYFIGFAPAKKPRFSLMILIDEPEGLPYGGLVAAPAFRNIGMRTLAMLNEEKEFQDNITNISDFVGSGEAHDVSASGDFGTATVDLNDKGMPDLTGMSYREVLGIISRKGLKANLVGNGFVVEQKPKAGSSVQRGDECFVRLKALN